MITYSQIHHIKNLMRDLMNNFSTIQTSYLLFKRISDLKHLGLVKRGVERGGKWFSEKGCGKGSICLNFVHELNNVLTYRSSKYKYIDSEDRTKFCGCQFQEWGTLLSTE